MQYISRFLRIHSKQSNSGTFEEKKLYIATHTVNEEKCSNFVNTISSCFSNNPADTRNNVFKCHVARTSNPTQDLVSVSELSCTHQSPNNPCNPFQHDFPLLLHIYLPNLLSSCLSHENKMPRLRPVMKDMEDIFNESTKCLKICYRHKICLPFKVIATFTVELSAEYIYFSLSSLRLVTLD